MSLFALGLNHHTAPLAVRERMTFLPEALPDALGELTREANRAVARFVDERNDLLRRQSLLACGVRIGAGIGGLGLGVGLLCLRGGHCALGLVLVGGLLLSQLLTLFTTPVIYLFFDRLGQRFGRRREPLVEAEA